MTERKQAILFFDIDGTIVWRDAEAARQGEDVPRFDRIAPSPAVMDAFCRLRERGHVPCICTGRSFCQIPQSIRDLNPCGWLVMAGSYIEFEGVVIRDARIPAALLEQTVQVLFDLGIDAEFESNTGLVGFYPTDTPPRFPDFAVEHTIDAFISRAAKYPLAKFCVHSYSQQRMDELSRFAVGTYSMCDLTHDVMEFSMMGCNKGSAIRAVLDYVKMDRGQAFAFGDSENDLSMADEVGYFVAPSNALERVKGCASMIAPPVWDDGIPAALEQLGLI